MGSFVGFLDTMVTDISNDPVTYLVAVALLIAGGLLAKYLLQRHASERRQITWNEFGAAALVIIFLQVPLVNVGMTEFARSQAVGGYQELYGDTFKRAYTGEDPCNEDDTDCGPTQKCHPYQAKVLDYVETVKDPDTYDKTTKTWKRDNSHEVKHYKNITRYHQCPYFKYMTTWLLESDLDDDPFVVARTIPLQPQRFEAEIAFPQDLVPRAPPAYWVEVKAKLDNHQIAPRQKRHSYSNPLLAVQADKAENYADDIAGYRKRNLLVDHTANLSDPIGPRGYAEQVAFVCQAPPNAEAFQESLAEFNAEFGHDHHGDMNVVVVCDSQLRADECHDYADALRAYWQTSAYGKFGLAKNTVMVVLGVSDDFKTITCSEARTGIDFGNGAMLLALNGLRGPFDPTRLFGSPTQSVDDKGEVTYVHSSGAIEKIVMDEYPFKRPCMITCDEGEEGGFEYVGASYMMTSGDFALLYSINVLAGGGLFLLVALVEFRGGQFRRVVVFVRSRIRFRR